MTEPMSEERLREIEARANAATRGPWLEWDCWGPFLAEYTAATRIGPEIGPGDDKYAGIVVVYGGSSDLDFVANARDDIPDMLAEIRRLQAENERLRNALYNTFRVWHDGE